MTPFTIRRLPKSGPCSYGDAAIVADGLVLSNGLTVIGWRGEHQSIQQYACPEDMIAVHCHEGTIINAVGANWEMVLDPWHADAFVGTPAEGRGATGKRSAFWYEVDWVGNLIGNVGPVIEIARIDPKEAQKLPAIAEIALLPTPPQESAPPSE
jgi:hypothetical protein